MKTEILLTGATGFIGSFVTQECLRCGFDVHILKQRDSSLWRLDKAVEKIHIHTIEEDLNELFSKHNFIAIIHMATVYDRNEKRLHKVAQANLNYPLTLLEIAAENHCQAFINLDTFLPENYPNLPAYSLSKKQFKKWLKLFPDMCCINLELQHPYGPKDSPHKFIPFIIANLTKEVASLKLTEGLQRRDFIFVEDVAKAIVAVLQQLHKLTNGFYDYQIGSGSTISIRELVLKIKEISTNDKTYLEFGSLPYRADEVMFSQAQINSFQNTFSWQPQTSLAVGLERTIKETKVNYG